MKATTAAPEQGTSSIDGLLREFRATLVKDDPGAVLQRAVSRLPILLGADRVFIAQLSTDQKRLIITHESDGARPSVLGLSQPIAQMPKVFVESFGLGKNVAIDDLEKFPLTDRQKRSLRFTGVGALVFMPFAIERTIAGVLCVDMLGKGRKWESEALAAIHRVASALGQSLALGKRGVYLASGDRTLEISNAQINVLANLARLMADQRAVSPVIAAANAELSNIYGQSIDIVLHRDGKAPNTDDRALAEAMMTGELISRTGEGASRVIVPMRSDGESLGAIDLRVPADMPLTASNAQFLRAVADLVGAALASAQRYEQLRIEAITDALTGLANHRHLLETYAELFAQSKSSGSPLSLLMVDIDRLREVNNAFGHRIGDEVLRYVARQLQQAVRHGELAGRFGGEEFKLVFPGTPIDEAAVRARRLIEKIADESPHDLPRTTVSVGISEMPMHAKERERLMELADKALYVAKYGGRNRVQVVYKHMNADWEKLAIEAYMSVLTSKSFSTGPHAIENAATRVAQAGGRNLDMALALAEAVDVRDKYTSGHSHAVANYSLKLAKALKYGPEELEEIRLGAMLHDIGKIGTPEAILGKQGPLTDAEYEIMKKHPADGAKILAHMPSMRRVASMVESHQEAWNGTGYPQRLSGEDIPRHARIVSIADAYHAMVSTRPYRKGMPMETACGILSNGAGKQWDPRLVEAFVSSVAHTR